MKSIQFLILLFLLGGTLYAQDDLIKLQNSSFEGKPQDATTPVGWHPCELMTTPDILPGIWGVTNDPSEGETFVGIITRPNNTFESIGQRLTAPLLPGECYSFTVDVAHSKAYLGYNKAIKLRVWGGTEKCDKDLLIGKTGFVEEEEWETISFDIIPQEGSPINYLIFEAFYTDKEFSRKGNILLDNVSVIKKCKRAGLDAPEQNMLTQKIEFRN